jgi:hypothetical protein
MNELAVRFKRPILVLLLMTLIGLVVALTLTFLHLTR